MMTRRGFLKNSIGALLLASLTSNKVIASVVKTIPKDSLDVLLYLIQTKDGDWKIRGTIWTKLAQQKLSSRQYNIETFKPLQIVDNKDANVVKKKYWVEYNCKGRCVGLDYLQCYKNGVIAKKSGQFQSIATLGGSKTLKGKGYTDIQKKGTDTIIHKRLGLFNPKYDEVRKEWGNKGGMRGGPSCVSKRKGIHIDDDVLRREWARLGGLKTISNLNRERECPYCGIKTRGAAYNRWHGENCKHKQ
jgi:hypothetical protein